MILLIVLQLVSVFVKGLPTEETGETLRKSRQLDLGLQEIIINNDSRSPQNSQSLPKQTFQSLLREYLPPISPSSSDIVLSTQTQSTLKLDPSTQAEKENLLCKLPFDFILCNKKKIVSQQQEFNTLTEDVKKPSKELIPPFTDVSKHAFTTLSSKEPNVQTETVSEKQLAFAQNAVLTTTKKAFAKKYSSAETANQFTKYSNPQEKNDVLNTAAASIESRNYLPPQPEFASATNAASVESRNYLPPQPEFASAAQTAVEVVKPKNDEHGQHDHHHHHHHHHHDENFDICADAFHSFLCAPLKPRKIITGAFPENLRGQGSFVKYQKVLPNREELPAPSNTFQNEYLPPEKPKNFEFGASFNSIKTTEQPPKSTSSAFSKNKVFTATSPPVKSFAPPKIVLEPKVVNVPVSPISSIPVIEPLKTSTVSQKLVNVNVPLSPISPIPIIEPLKPSTISQKVVNVNVPLSPISSIPIIEPLKSSTSSPKIVDVSFPLNPISSISVIEPFKPSTTPNSLLLYTSVPLTDYPSIKTSSSINEFNSVFIPTVTTVKPILGTSTQVSFKTLPEKLGSSSSISATFDTSNNILPQVVPFNSQPTNEDRFYLPPLPSATFISTAKTFSLASEPANSPFVSTKIFSPSPTQSTFPSSQQVYSVPQSTTRSTSIIVPTKQLSSTITKTPLSSFKALPTTSQPATVAAPSFKPLPSKIDNSYLPPLPKFDTAANSVTTTTKPFRPTPKKIVVSPKLIERPSNVDRSYLPPDPNVQPAAAQVDPVAVAPKVQNPFHHGRDLCTDPFHSFLCTPAKPRKRITGSAPSRFNADSSNTNELKVRPIQNSQKPVVLNLPKPSSSAPQFTTAKPFSKQPDFKFVAPTIKPKKIFPAPTEQKVFAAKPSSIDQITIKPEILRQSETKAAIGYDYPKPASAFPLPSEQQNQISSTTGGYSYPKPLKPFSLPTELKEVIQSTTPPPPPPPPPPAVLKPSSTNQASGYHYPKPEQSFELPQRQGYFYPKPQKQLVLPTEQEAKPFPSVDVLGNLGSAEFIPVNKLEKRNPLSQSSKFGDRLRRRGRSH